MKKNLLLKSISLFLCMILLMSAVIAPMSCFAKDDEDLFFYGKVTMPEITENEYWDSKSEDYDVQQNLLLGLQPQIMCGKELNDLQKEYCTKLPVTMLTDGEYSVSQNVHNGKYFEIYTSSYRSILFDLTKVSSVSAFKTSFLNKTSWGVYVPTKVEVKASLDGDLWYKVADISISSEDDKINRDEFILDSPVAARFVCFYFSTPSAWTGCDELEVVGAKNAENATDLSTLGVKGYHFIQDEYPEISESLLGGVSDMLLAYHSRTFDWDEEHFEPFVTYLDKDGNAKDTMFDGYLFLLSGLFPSGKRGYEASKMSDWTWELNKLFTAGKNIDALNSASGKAKEKLGLDNYKYKFYITIYYPDYAQTNFGDVDGDGVTENFNNVEDRVKALKWYVDEFYSRYNPSDYENLEFGGFYWYNESIPANDRNRAVLNGVADYIHEKNSQFFWIPYYGAGGYYCPEEFGFDVACMQPNLAFEKSTPYSQFYSSINLSKQYGLGVEIEAHNGVLTDKDFFDRYITYLKNASIYGYDNSIHMYYQDVLSFYNACKSTNPMSRAVYDYTYDFIKGKLKAQPDSESYTVETKQNLAVSDALHTEERDYPTNYTLTAEPEHGEIVIGEDGAYTYTPDKDFYGEDSFCYTYNNLIDESENCVVTIKVNHVHSEISADNAVAPGCNTQGKESDIICSQCGEVITAGETLSALGHSDKNSDNKCDICGETIDKTKECSCVCHKTGIMGFLYQIIRIFWKIFGTNKTCNCGINHY